jgi:hypothetical protein
VSSFEGIAEWHRKYPPGRAFQVIIVVIIPFPSAKSSGQLMHGSETEGILFMNLHKLANDVLVEFLAKNEISDH